MKLFIVISNGGPFRAGTIVRKFDQGYSKVTTDDKGKINGQEDLIVPHLSLDMYLLPYNLRGQWDLYNGEAMHRAAADGNPYHAVQDAIFNQPMKEADEFDDPEEYM